MQWPAGRPDEASSPQARLQCLLQLLAHVVRRGRLLRRVFPRGRPGTFRPRVERLVRLRRRRAGRRQPALASRGGPAAAPDLGTEVLHGAPQHNVLHVQRFQLPPHQRERRLAVSLGVRRGVRGLAAPGGEGVRPAALPATRVGARGLLDGQLAHDQQRHLADGRACGLAAAAGAAVVGEQLRRSAQAPIEPQARPSPQREHAPCGQLHPGQQRADPALGPRRRHVRREPAPGERERRRLVDEALLVALVGRLPDLTDRGGGVGRCGAERVGEGEVAEPWLEAEEEGRRGRVGGEEVELGGEREGRARRGAERAEPRPDGEREGEPRVVGAVREAERRARRERRGEVEAELPRVAAGGEPRLERQPQHADRHLGPHQRPVIVAELDRSLHRARRSVGCSARWCWCGGAVFAAVGQVASGRRRRRDAEVRFGFAGGGDRFGLGVDGRGGLRVPLLVLPVAYNYRRDHPPRLW
ncbi:hypothetical protein HU200_061777 [Digitaria exilis]|uniref:Uncharacterized protein n=1 Tax=Digitaria exilis TaxID=1010633 RepID=A0A835DZ93_9POAL|nr:hypothetical protein HU200_061777 [Digitaria exilis]